MTDSDPRPAVPGLGGTASARCLVMGVLNVTPDSFSDGGRWDEVDQAIARGRQLVADGADLVDVGGESTRPGAQRVPVQAELQRVVPVVAALAGEGVAVSVDTMRAQVAAAAVEAGAVLVNDVSGGLGDPDMGPMVAQTGARYVVMHWRGLLSDPAATHHYDDVVAEVCGELTDRVDVLLGQGVREEQLVLDPGLGFSKDAGHNWTLLAGLDPLLQASAAARVVGVTSSRARKHVPFWSVYGASKAAFEHLLLTYAAEREAMRINLFDPGPVATRMRAKAMPGEDQSGLTRPEEVATVIADMAGAGWTRTGDTVAYREVTA